LPQIESIRGVDALARRIRSAPPSYRIRASPPRSRVKDARVGLNPIAKSQCLQTLENGVPNERAVFIGRKGLLLSDTVAGPKASANRYSLVETAKANGVEPRAYLSRLFERSPLAKTVEDFEALLPWNPKGALRASQLRAIAKRQDVFLLGGYDRSAERRLPCSRMASPRWTDAPA